MRTLVIKQDTDLRSLSSALLATGLAAGKSESALESLRALNPHVDLNKLAPGMILLVPDAPAFKTSDSKSIAGAPLDELQQLVRSGLEAAAVKLRQGHEKRTAQRAEVAAVLKTAAVKRILDADPESKKQLEDAVKGFKDDEQADARAETSLKAAIKDAQVELASLQKLIG